MPEATRKNAPDTPRWCDCADFPDCHPNPAGSCRAAATAALLNAELLEQARERDRAIETRENANAVTRRVEAERDRWIRLFNRLDGAISHHQTATRTVGFVDTYDEALYAARARILRAAAESTTPTTEG